jgi:3-methylcrotonyl-CoA carboxylase alpha subunit
MIAKVIVHGPTRAIALNRLAMALDGTQVAGTVTNLDFLRALARHDGFVRGEVDTGLIGRDLAALLAVPAPDALDLCLRATAALAAADVPAGPLAGFALWAPLRHRVRLEPGLEAVVEVSGATAAVEIGGKRVLAGRVGSGWRIGGMGPLDVVRDGAMLHVFAPGRQVSFTVPDPLDRTAAAMVSDDVIRSPMPGLVREVAVAAGQAVAAGDRLAVLEAMKMQHMLAAPRDGVVADVLAAAGDQVQAGAALVALLPL